MITAFRTGYGEMAKTIAALEQEIEDAEDELGSLENQMDSLENDIFNLKVKRDKIKKGYSFRDLSNALPSVLRERGHRLTELTVKIPHSQKQITLFPHTDLMEIYRFTVLENNKGDIVNQWERSPSLTDILEVENG